ncbi:MmgE/PrpD family protein [Trebonia sp.]|uniref:MmgE/PrpD family protein n=1 Tax=Trebonia sp. TaxID=2767075 RepID=UPI003BAFC6D9
MDAYEEDWGGAVLAIGVVRDRERQAARHSGAIARPPRTRGEPKMTSSTPTAVTATGRPATDPAGPTGRLATWVAKTTLDDVPASVRDRAKYLVLDGIGCALVGAQLPWSRIGVEGVTALDDAGDSALIGWDGRATSATSAAMLNSSFIQGFELDDYHPLAPLHSNSLVLPAMLAAAPRVGRVSGERFLLGAILGYETGPPGRGGARRPGHALPGVAFGCGLRPSRRGRCCGNAVRAGRRRV